MIDYVTIYPSERVVYELDFSEALPPGSTSIVSATVEVYKITSSGALGTAYNGLVENTTCTVNSNTARFILKNAIADERYRCEVVATTNDAQIFKTRIYFKTEGA